MQLNAVYSAWWFLLILAFLVVSTSLCIARNTPKILADLKVYKENIREQKPAAFHHKAEAVRWRNRPRPQRGALAARWPAAAGR
jgi:cytochrome c biogenesis protein